MVAHDMVRVGLEDHPLAATAVLVWNGDLPRPLQQILFDAADSIAPADPAWASSTGARVKELNDPTAVTAAAGPGPVFQRATA